MKQSTDARPTTTPLPDGLRLRAYAGEADAAAYVEIKNAEHAADWIPSRESLDDAKAYFAHPSEHFDPYRDLTFAEVEGRPVAFTEREWIDTRGEDLREYRVDGFVLPEFRGRGIGRALLDDNERRARELAATHDTSRGRVLGSWTGEHQERAHALLRDAGYREVRWFFEMLRPTLDDVVHMPVPEGLVVRGGSAEMFRDVWLAIVEAFEDHWGGFDDSDASLQRWKDSPNANPSLWLIAFDGDQIAGGVINTINRAENEALGLKRGWLDIVFTRRPWRRRGLARALLGQSFDVLREAGMTSAVLGVDADNPSGALGLYETAGFEVDARFSAWRKPMDR